jgi:hypothetical protein
MSKFFLTILVSFSTLAPVSAQTKAMEIPKLVRLSDLKEEFAKLTTAQSAQRPSKAIEANRRLRLLWARARQQTNEPLCMHWSVEHAVRRVKFLQSYDNYETDELEYEELTDLTKQLDENGCCAFLPESNWYRVRE